MRLALILALVAGCGADSDVSRAVGARCDVKADCDERCLPPSGDYPDGLCTLSCVNSDDCPDDTACVQDEGGVCLIRCVDDPGCEFLGAGWRCEPREAPGGGEVKVCRGD